MNNLITDQEKAVEEQFVKQEAEQARRRELCRERILTRLWQIADLDTEKTRNSAAMQMKALTTIIALEGLLPDRRAAASEKKADPLPVANIYQSAWLREQQEKTAQSSPAVTDAASDAAKEHTPPQGTDQAADNIVSAEKVSAVPEPPPVAPVNPVQTTVWSPYARVPDAAPDNRLPFRIQANPFKPRRPSR